MTPVALRAAYERAVYGGKAAQLATALRARLPVPDGFALSRDAVTAIADGRHAVGPGLARKAGSNARFAVRSSAIDEDSEGASFAGQHTSLLNVAADEVDEAVCEVWRSAQIPSALAYRRKRGLEGATAMAVVVQHMVRARVAGVLFTRHPVTGARERVIEASWGLGEAVVAGLVTPDAFRVAPDGRVLERVVGHKDLEIGYSGDKGTIALSVDDERAGACCLDDTQLQALSDLAADVERVFAGDHDLEWAFDESGVHLLQRRSITT